MTEKDEYFKGPLKASEGPPALVKTLEKPPEIEQRRKQLRELADKFLGAWGPYLAQEAKWRAIEAQYKESSMSLVEAMCAYKSFKLARNSMLIEYDIEKDSGELDVSPLTNLDAGQK